MKWSEQLRLRERIHQRYPDLWSLKIIRKRLPIILKYLRDGEAILEVGASNRDLGGRIRKYFPKALYKSLDVDPSYPHDYSGFEEIKETFDMILLFEVIEHLTLDEGREMVRNIYQILKPAGRVIVTTPNVYTPGRYWRDATHQTAYHYEELGGLMLHQHFEILEIFRVFNGPLLSFLAKVYVFPCVFRFLGIDFTKSILIVARKG
ncbi:MAG: class I SAM-dependent methyltransferase [Thermodesulfobacteriota bacterium]